MGPEDSAEPPAVEHEQLHRPGSTLKQISGSWIYKGEWNGTISNNAYVEARYGVFGYYFPLLANTDSNEFQIVNAQLAQYFNADQKEQTDRQRRQGGPDRRVFQDALLGGSAQLQVRRRAADGDRLVRLPAGMRRQRAREHRHQRPGEQRLHGRADATQVGSLGDGPNGNLLSISKLNTIDAFVTDQYTVGRATFNLGLRWDHYDVFTRNNGSSRTFPTAVAFSIPAQTFPEAHYLKWNGIVPRLGMSYDLTGDGKTVVKVNWGVYKFNPGVGVADNANPNQALKTVTFAWTDRNADGKFQTGEEGTLTASALSGSVLVDPNLKQPGSTGDGVSRTAAHRRAARVSGSCIHGARPDQHLQNQRPASAYTVPFNFADRGPTTSSASDDQNLVLRHPVSARQRLQRVDHHADRQLSIPDDADADESAGGRQVQDGRVFGQQAPEPQLLARRRLRLYVAARLPGGLPGHELSQYAERAVRLRLPQRELQTEWHVQRAVGHQHQPRVPLPGRDELRADAVGVGAGVVPCVFSAARGGSLANTTVYADKWRQRAGQHLGVRRSRGRRAQYRSRHQLRLFFDAFNLINAYAGETITVQTGALYLQPTAILAPRTGRIGARFVW